MKGFALYVRNPIYVEPKAVSLAGVIPFKFLWH